MMAQVKDLPDVFVGQLDGDFGFFHDHVVEIFVFLVAWVNQLECHVFVGSFSAARLRQEDLCHSTRSDLLEQVVVSKLAGQFCHAVIVAQGTMNE